MKTAHELQNAIDNIRYYSNKIRNLVDEEWNSIQQHTEVNQESCETVMTILAIIHSNTTYFDLYCDNIKNNVSRATEKIKMITVVQDG